MTLIKDNCTRLYELEEVSMSEIQTLLAEEQKHEGTGAHETSSATEAAVEESLESANNQEENLGGQPGETAATG